MSDLDLSHDGPDSLQCQFEDLDLESFCQAAAAAAAAAEKPCAGEKSEKSECEKLSQIFMSCIIKK